MRIRRAGVRACALNVEDAMQPRVLVLFWNRVGGEPVTGYGVAQGFDGCSIIMQDCGKGPRTRYRSEDCCGVRWLPRRGARELRGFTEAAGRRMLMQRTHKVLRSGHMSALG